MIPIKKSITKYPEKLASLRANKDPRDRDDPGYIDYFYTPAHELLKNQEWMVDFGQLISLPNKEFPSILDHKILQMDDRSRVKFKIKAAVYLGRIADEEGAAGLREPWQDSDAGYTPE